VCTGDHMELNAHENMFPTPKTILCWPLITTLITLVFCLKPDCIKGFECLSPRAGIRLLDLIYS
jgi:hypothetical protein